MKLIQNRGLLQDKVVAPLVGAWIEMNLKQWVQNVIAVAPLVGAWIEITVKTKVGFDMLVAPLVGAWIEILVSI